MESLMAQAILDCYGCDYMFLTLNTIYQVRADRNSSESMLTGVTNIQNKDEQRKVIIRGKGNFFYMCPITSNNNDRHNNSSQKYLPQ